MRAQVAAVALVSALASASAAAQPPEDAKASPVSEPEPAEPEPTESEPAEPEPTEPEPAEPKPLAPIDRAMPPLSAAPSPTRERLPKVPIIEDESGGLSVTATGGILFALGGAAMGVGVALGVLAKNKADEADAFCVDDFLRDICRREGLDLRDEARPLALSSSVTIAVGFPLILIGIYLMAAGPKTFDERTVSLDDGGLKVRF